MHRKAPPRAEHMPTNEGKFLAPGQLCLAEALQSVVMESSKFLSNQYPFLFPYLHSCFSLILLSLRETVSPCSPDWPRTQNSTHLCLLKATTYAQL